MELPPIMMGISEVSFKTVAARTDMCRLMTGIHSEKSVLGDFVVMRMSYSVLTQI
jgi:hypothetical protein